MATNNHPTAGRLGADRGFTLLELIVVVAIIAILLGLVLLAMGGVTKAGSRADSANTLRQMMAGYIAYSSDHRSRLMPGYIDPADIGTAANQINIEAELSNGRKLAPGDVAPYIWRLMPYVDHEWKLFTRDYRAAQVDATIEAEIGVEDGTGIYGPATASPTMDIGLALRPSFGLNSIYCGGDSAHGGPTAEAFNPFTPATPGLTIAATRMSEVLNASRLIVFAPTVVHDRMVPDQLAKFDVEFGSAELRPPYIFDPSADSFGPAHWSVDRDGRAITDDAPASVYDFGGGIPIARWSDTQIPTGRMDGSTGSDSIDLLGPPAQATVNDAGIREIMKAWWPFATGYR